MTAKKMIPLDSLGAGNIFRDGDFFYRRPPNLEGNDSITCLRIGGTLARSFHPLYMVEPINLEDLFGRISALEQENEEMSLCIHDKRVEFSHWIEQGAALERQQILAIATSNDERRFVGTGRELSDLFRTLVADRGPVLSETPPDRLKAENEKLRTTLEEIHTIACQASSLHGYSIIMMTVDAAFGRPTDGSRPVAGEEECTDCDSVATSPIPCRHCRSPLCRDCAETSYHQCHLCRESCGICSFPRWNCRCAEQGLR
jgi:hypothetical protein